MAGFFSGTAVGVLTGAITGAGMGFMYGNAPGAVVGAVAGATTGYLGAEESRKKEWAMKQAQRDQAAAGIANENALVKEAYNKRKNAMGLGDVPGNAAGNTGGILTSVTGTDQNNLIG